MSSYIPFSMFVFPFIVVWTLGVSIAEGQLLGAWSQERLPVHDSRGEESMTALNEEIEGRRTSLWTSSVLREGEGLMSFPRPVVRLSNQRASSAHIGAVMAVLATFDEARVLPPEHDSQANQLIHTLIQLQSVVMKSQDSTVHDWVLKALQAKFGEVAARVQEHVRAKGLTMDFLEALVDYGDIHPFWDRAELAGGFQTYNVGQEDWMLLRKILLDARRQLAGRGDTLSAVFARRRLEMPGAVP